MPLVSVKEPLLVDRSDAGEHQVDLTAHQLLGETRHELVMRHVGELPEMHMASGRDHRVDLADLGIERIDRTPVADIDLDVAALRPCLDDLVTTAAAPPSRPGRWCPRHRR